MSLSLIPEVFNFMVIYQVQHKQRLELGCLIFFEPKSNFLVFG